MWVERIMPGDTGLIIGRRGIQQDRGGSSAGHSSPEGLKRGGQWESRGSNCRCRADDRVGLCDRHVDQDF